MRRSVGRCVSERAIKCTGDLRSCQLLLGHRKLESTVRHLGIEFDDAL